MKGEFTPVLERSEGTVIEKRGKWYVGYIEEIPGVNTQGKTKEKRR